MIKHPVYQYIIDHLPLSTQIGATCTLSWARAAAEHGLPGSPQRPPSMDVADSMGA
jgi:hypothetical protein